MFIFKRFQSYFKYFTQKRSHKTTGLNNNGQSYTKVVNEY